MVDVSKLSNIFLLGRGENSNADYPALAQVEAYWDALYAQGSLPRRSEIDPRALDQALSFAFVLERVAPRVGRFRLAGGHLGDLMGLELRGMPLTALFLPEARDQIATLVESTCTRPAISQVLLQAKGGFGHANLSAKLLLAPLLDDDGNVTRILGCLQSLGKIGHQPRRFTIVKVMTRALQVADLPAFASSKAQKPAIHGFAEAPARFVNHPVMAKPEAARRALKLVVDNS